MGHGGTGKRLGDGSLLTQDADEGLGHILPRRVYLNTLLSLLVLTVLTVAVARVDLGALNVAVAILVASTKALLVCMFFMHLKFEGKLIIAYAIYPIILLILMVGGILEDFKRRAEPLPMTGFQESMQHSKMKPNDDGSHSAKHD